MYKTSCLKSTNMTRTSLRFSLLLTHLSGLLAFVCPTRRIQCDGRPLHCLLCLPQYDVVTLCRGFATTELVSLEEKESARTLGVLDVDG